MRFSISGASAVSAARSSGEPPLRLPRLRPSQLTRVDLDAVSSDNDRAESLL